MSEVVRDFTHTNDRDSAIVTWSGLDGDDSGKAVDLSRWPDKTAQVLGTFGGATLTLYGSNDPAVLTDRAAGTLFGSKTAVWVIAQDSLGNNFAKAAAGGDVLLENYKYWLPVVTGGDGTTSLKCIINAARSRN
jgi:hypothetical protein